MSTFMQKKESVVRKWYVIDAAEKPLGKTAVAAADLLRGKNAEKAVLTGNKMTDKYYYHHSGYIGGMKKVQYKTLMATKPERAMELAVKGMLPDTVIGRKAFTRLKVYAGATHNHEAQKPQVYDL